MAIRRGFPPFDAVLPLFRYGGMRLVVPTRMADRAVLVELIRFLAVNHIPSSTICKQEVVGSNPIGSIPAVEIRNNFPRWADRRFSLTFGVAPVLQT